MTRAIPAVLFVLGTAGLQTASPLSTLTVSADALPAGCSIKVLEPRRPGAPPAFVESFPANPWIGDTRRWKLLADRIINGEPQLPDSPPDRREIARVEAQLADDIADAYHAEYVTTSGQSVSVTAVRFKDPNRAQASLTPAPATTARPAPVHITRGATMAMISGDTTNPCFRAVADHVNAWR